jgi:carbon monoxide dehydrogenase subunit G
MHMKFEGRYELKAPPDRIWEYIIDPAKIGQCLPGLKSLEIESANKFLAVARVGVGPIKADFKFRIEITGKEPSRRVQLKALGSGSGSSVNLNVAIEIRQVSAGTELDYRSDMIIGGAIAGLGQRVLADAATKTVADVFDCVKRHVEQR